jgi:ATP-dependent DNA ligase
MIDGELVVLQGGRADFAALLARHQRNPAHRLSRIGPQIPIHYIAFDLLFHKGQSLLRRPLHERRERLGDLLARVGDSLVAYSDGIVGCGRYTAS